jgi:hypothetical protein
MKRIGNVPDMQKSHSLVHFQKLLKFPCPGLLIRATVDCNQSVASPPIILLGYSKTKGLTMFDCSKDDPCIAAIRQTYSHLKGAGMNEADAFSAAVRVLRNHHPSLALADAYDVATVWIDSSMKETRSDFS